MLSSFLNTLSHYLSLAGLPQQYIWLGPVIIFLLSMALMFSGKRTWRIMIAVLGAIVGYELFVVYILPITSVQSFINHYGLPQDLLIYIVAIVSAILFGLFVRFFLSGIIGYAGYIAAVHFQPYILTYIAKYIPFDPTYLMIAIGFTVGAIAYALYNKLTVLVAAAIGTIGIWYTMVLIGISAENATYVAVVLLSLGLYYQTHKKEIAKSIHKAKAEKA